MEDALGAGATRKSFGDRTNEKYNDTHEDAMVKPISLYANPKVSLFKIIDEEKENEPLSGPRKKQNKFCRHRMTQLTIRSKERAPWESVLRCREQAGTVFRIEKKLCPMKA